MAPNLLHRIRPRSPVGEGTQVSQFLQRVDERVGIAVAVRHTLQQEEGGTVLTPVTFIVTEYLFQLRTVLARTLERAFQARVTGAGKHTQHAYP